MHQFPGLTITVLRDGEAASLPLDAFRGVPTLRVEEADAVRLELAAGGYRICEIWRKRHGQWRQECRYAGVGRTLTLTRDKTAFIRLTGDGEHTLRLCVGSEETDIPETPAPVPKRRPVLSRVWGLLPPFLRPSNP